MQWGEADAFLPQYCSRLLLLTLSLDFCQPP